MKKHLIGVVGFFGTKESRAGGQEAKTCALTRAFEENYGKDEVVTVDTRNWKKHPFRLLGQIILAARNCKNIFMLPAQNAVRIFVPLFVVLRYFCKCKQHYAVVGGWLPTITAENKVLAFFAKKLDGIYVETNTMRTALEAQGFGNVFVLPNFKFITPLRPEELSENCARPHKLCTFSRVMQEKGIEDAIAAVRAVNEKYGTTVYELDIYGKIDPSYEERFQQIMEEVPPYIRYCGMVEPEESVEVLKSYFALLFPTHYATEGVPGTIIDAYASGVPVITALWNNSADVFEEGVNGWGYELNDQSAFVGLLDRLVHNPESFAAMKKIALQAAKKYQPDYLIRYIDSFIEK